MHPQGSDLHRVAPVAGGGDPAGRGGNSTGSPRALHPLLPLSNSAPSAANCAAHRRGYPRALTGSNPGAGGGGGGGGHCARAAAHLPRPHLAGPAPARAKGTGGGLVQPFSIWRSQRTRQSSRQPPRDPQPDLHLRAGVSGRLAGTAQTAPWAQGVQSQHGTMLGKGWVLTPY